MYVCVISYIHNPTTDLLIVLNGVFVGDVAPFMRRSGPSSISCGTRNTVYHTTTVVVALQGITVVTGRAQPEYIRMYILMYVRMCYY